MRPTKCNDLGLRQTKFLCAPDASVLYQGTVSTIDHLSSQAKEMPYKDNFGKEWFASGVTEQLIKGIHLQIVHLLIHSI